MNIYEQIKSHSPFDEDEAASKQSFLMFMEAFQGNLLTRDNVVGHFCASAFVINKGATKVLMAYHNLYKSFTWLGGHADGDEYLARVALKETSEESGVAKPRLARPGIYDLSVLHVAPHVKRGRIVASHLHYTAAYLVEADEDEVLQIAENENSAVAWLDIGTFTKQADEEIMQATYRRLVDKLG